MKKVFIFLMSLLPIVAFAQTPAVGTPAAETPGNFSVQAKIGNLNTPARAYLFYQVGANKVVDSALIVNGVFSFKGDVIDPNPASLVIDHKGAGLSTLDPKTADGLAFYLEKGDLTVTSAIDSVSKAKVAGSPVTDAYNSLIVQIKPLINQAKALQAEEAAATPAQQQSDTYQQAEEAKHAALAGEQTSILEKFIKANPNNYFSLFVLSSLGPTPDYIVLNSLFSSLSPALQNTEVGKTMRKAIDKLQPTAVGSIAPDFTQDDVNGTPVSLSSFRGKYVLIDFWASWCGPCRAENPNVVKAYNKFKGKNFTIIGVSLDKPDGKADWLAAIKSDGLTWTQVSDLNSWNNQVALLYSVQSIPHNFLLDPTGKIIAKDLRGHELDNKLTEIFGSM
jgi:peroxiredoxin